MAKSHLIISLLICLPLKVMAYEYKANRPPPVPFTQQEQAAFEDAPNLFPINRLPDVGIKFKGLSWFNDNTAIAGLDHFGQWTAKHTELPKVSLLNIDTGTITETPYRGRLICYRPDQILVCPDYLFPCSAKGTHLLVGKYGEELQSSDTSVFSGFDKNTCESTPFTDSNSIDVINNPKTPKDSKFRALGKDAGYIGWSEAPVRTDDFSFRGKPFGFFNNNFEPYWQGYQGKCDSTFTIFHPWDKSYLMGHEFYQGAWECAQYRVFLIHPNEKVQEIALPSLFEGWLRDHIAGINLAMTKKGLLVYPKPDSEINRIGLYWVSAQGKIKRLIANRLVEFLSVAPDGCHVLIQHHETNLVMVGVPATEAERKRIMKTFETSVIDMCKEEG